MRFDTVWLSAQIAPGGQPMESKKSLSPISDLPSDVAELCRQIERWRQTRRHLEHMPARLWTMAASLAREHTVARIARLARLDYYALRDRLKDLAVEPTVKHEKRPSFVELPASLCAPSAECIVELEHPRGGRMRIHVKGVPTPDLAALSRSFWSLES
jgi:hypothetical protein